MMIRGKSLYLRSACIGDLEFLKKWWSNIDLMRNFDQIPPMTYQQMEQKFKRNLNSNNHIDFIVEDKLNKPFGLIYLKNINWRNRNAELHTLIADSLYQNLGFGIEAQYYILKFAFQQINLHKLYGRVMEYAGDNIKLMEFVGYKKEAVCKKAVFNSGRSWDVYIFGLLRREFEAFLNQEKKRIIDYAEID